MPFGLVRFGINCTKQGRDGKERQHTAAGAGDVHPTGFKNIRLPENGISIVSSRQEFRHILVHCLKSCKHTRRIPLASRPSLAHNTPCSLRPPRAVLSIVTPKVLLLHAPRSNATPNQDLGVQTPIEGVFWPVCGVLEPSIGMYVLLTTRPFGPTAPSSLGGGRWPNAMRSGRTSNVVF